MSDLSKPFSASRCMVPIVTKQTRGISGEKGRKLIKLLFLLIIIVAFFLFSATVNAEQSGKITGWGLDDYGQATPPAGSDYVAIAAGDGYSLALKQDGSIVGWGKNNYGQTDPCDGNDFVAIAAGWEHCLALKQDGSIVSWGRNNYGQADPCEGNDFVAIAAGGYHSLALKQDGSIVGWGEDTYGQADPCDVNDFVDIAAGGWHSLALKQDGSIVGWGRDFFGQATPPAGSNYVAIAAGDWHSLAIKQDGSIVGWGMDDNGQVTSPAGSGYAAIAAGAYHSLALKQSGSIVGWGMDDNGQATAPTGTKYIAIATGTYHSLSIGGDTIYVDASALGANDGTSWADAYKYLQDALSAAGTNCEIWMAQGTYRPDEDSNNPSGTGNRESTFQLKNGVTIYGGFPSGGGVWEIRDPNIHETILSGDINVTDVNTDNSYHVVTGSGTDANAILDGLTITAGNANGSNPYDSGGGMYNYGGSPTVINCIFSLNVGTNGGGMCNRVSSPMVTNCTFSANESVYGGGMCDSNSSPVVTNCTFSDNSASYGGGMGNSGSNSDPVVTNCAFSGNFATTGGGMYNTSNSSPIVTNCTFSGNMANGNYGGGMYNYDYSSPIVTNCILWGNTAAIGGNEIYNDYNSIIIITYSDVQGGWEGMGNINADPLFVNSPAGDLRLMLDSSCLDAGDNNSISPDYADLDGDGNTTELVPLDLAGNPRIWDADDDRQVIVDMGAFEIIRVADRVAGNMMLINDNAGWCWYQDEKIIYDPVGGNVITSTAANYGGFGGEFAQRFDDVDATTFNIATGKRTRALMAERGGDDHNMGAFWIRPDGRYLHMYAEHYSPDLSYYRVTTNPNDGNSWGSEQFYNWETISDMSSEESLTYTNLHYLSAEGSGSGRLYNIVRWLYVTPNISYSDDWGVTWHYAGILSVPYYTGGYSNYYHKFASNGVDRIDFIATEHHPREYNNSIYHGYIKNGKSYNSYGVEIDDSIYDHNVPFIEEFTPVFLTSPVEPNTYHTAWTNELELDSQGRPVCLFQTRYGTEPYHSQPGAADHRFFYGRFDGSTWTYTKLCKMGMGLHDPEEDYLGMGCIHPDDANLIYVSTPFDPRNDLPMEHHEIFKGVTSDNGLSWDWIQITFDSTVDNIRPAIPAWSANNTAVFWSRGFYPGQEFFDLVLVGIIDLEDEIPGLVTYIDANVTNTTESDGSPFTPTGPSGEPGATDGQWHEYTGYGNGGSCYTAGEADELWYIEEDAPTLKTTISGLAEGTYDVFAYFWCDPDEDWGIRGGFMSSDLLCFNKQSSQHAEASGFSGTVEVEDDEVVLYRVYIGRKEISGSDSIDVYIDNYGYPYYYEIYGSIPTRTTYDGVGVARVLIDYSAGDLNGDGKVNLLDIAVLGQDWLTKYNMYTLAKIADYWLMGT